MKMWKAWKINIISIKLPTVSAWKMSSFSSSLDFSLKPFEKNKLIESSWFHVCYPKRHFNCTKSSLKKKKKSSNDVEKRSSSLKWSEIYVEKGSPVVEQIWQWKWSELARQNV